ncbi:Hypothetical predicted protein [Olea europaea subsp. europaea]|uniref:DUF1995 domain-containing protein n=1 Tax=Olea europaea subsp. europaea TaxID=158383 RepID=A0A8S0TSM4_OLEEU|nr:Hypothetical predicted protein [Olea europaea subsp. europaea]
MDSKFLQIHHQTIKISDSKFHFLKPKTLPESRISFSSLSLKCSLSSTNPPTTKEEAILQVKTSLSSTLEKPLNNPRLAGKIKKVKQPRLRVEIPVIDDSPASLTQLALEVFGEMPIRRKGSKIKILIIWPTQSLTQAAAVAFESQSSNLLTENVLISSVLEEDPRVLNSADVVVFLSPESSQLSIMKTVTDSIYPKPVIIFNPKWGFEEESDFGELSGFVCTFEVVYSFMGLEVKGILSKRKGVIFKCVKDGILSGEKWNVLVEEEEELKVVSTFKARPSVIEVENVLYNLMAINSPITKSAKFLKELLSNVTGRKK